MSHPKEHHGNHGETAAQESVLVKILEKEKELDEAIAQAKAEAEGMIKSAGIKADNIREAAKQKKLEREKEQQANQAASKENTQVKSEEFVKWEQAELAAVKVKINANLPKAVKWVVEQALPTENK